MQKNAERPTHTSRRNVLAVALLPAVALGLFAQAPPSQDTFVASATPTTNYGPSISLIVGPGSTSYVQFNLSGVPAGASINKAMLRLYVDGVAKGGSFDVYQLNASWSESKLTYNTPPPPLGLSATSGHPVAVSAASVNQFILVDITTLVQNWVNGSIANHGVALALTTAGGGFAFDSKESVLTANGPELLLAYASGTGAQGPVGPAGPAGPQGPPGVQGTAGVQGLQGLQGLAGPAGADGATGAQGPAGKDGVGFSFRRAFDNSASYVVNDVVSYNGSSYVAIAANQGPNNPAPDTNSSAWNLMAQQGAVGPAGAAGQTGPAGPIGMMGPMGPQGPMPTGAALVTTPNSFAGNQTVNGSLILAGTGSGIQFGDGSVLSSAPNSGVVSTSTACVETTTGTSPIPPSGYSVLGTVTAGNLWTPAPPMPTPRGEFGIATIGTKVYAFGGNNNLTSGSEFPTGNSLSAFEVYDTSTNSWASLNPSFSNITSRDGHAMVALDQKLYVLGGRQDAIWQFTVVVVDTATNAFGGQFSMLQPRADLSAVAINGRIYSFGGDYYGRVLNWSEGFDPAIGSWQIADMPTARSHAAAVGINGKIYVLGGATNDGITSAVGCYEFDPLRCFPSSFTTVVEVYDPATNTWSTSTPMPVGLAKFSAVVVNGQTAADFGIPLIFVMGGILNSDPNAQTPVPVLNTKTYVFNTQTHVWSQTAAPMLTPSEGLGAVALNNQIFVVGGYPQVTAPDAATGASEAFLPPQTIYTYVKN